MEVSASLLRLPREFSQWRSLSGQFERILLVDCFVMLFIERFAFKLGNLVLCDLAIVPFFGEHGRSRGANCRNSMGQLRQHSFCPAGSKLTQEDDVRFAR
jgi:hypothetical protein